MYMCVYVCMCIYIYIYIYILDSGRRDIANRAYRSHARFMPADVSDCVPLICTSTAPGSCDLSRLKLPPCYITPAMLPGAPHAPSVSSLPPFLPPPPDLSALQQE